MPETRAKDISLLSVSFGSSPPFLSFLFPFFLLLCYLLFLFLYLGGGSRWQKCLKCLQIGDVVRKTRPMFLVKWRQQRFCCNLCLSPAGHAHLHACPASAAPLASTSLWCLGLLAGGRIRTEYPLLGLSATPGNHVQTHGRRQPGWTMLGGLDLL